MKYYKIGVIGGLGPLATAKFMGRVIDLREAKSDQENVDTIDVLANNVIKLSGKKLKQGEI